MVYLSLSLAVYEMLYGRTAVEKHQRKSFRRTGITTAAPLRFPIFAICLQYNGAWVFVFFIS